MISIIIPNFNGADFLPSLFSNLKKIIPSDTEIIFVDNGSADNSLSIVHKFYPSAVIISNKSNLGFGAAVNQGILTSHNPYVCLLNNDTTLSADWFKFITAAIKKYPQVACFCGTVLDFDGNLIESQGIDFQSSGRCLQINHGLIPKPNLTNHKPFLVWGSSAAAVVYKKAVLKEIGLFDEKYFAYLEDVDISFRLHHHRYQTLLVPRAIICHLGGGTADNMGNFRSRQTVKNWIYFIHKNYSVSQIIAHLPAIFFERLRNLSYLLKSTIR